MGRQRKYPEDASPGVRALARRQRIAAEGGRRIQVLLEEPDAKALDRVRERAGVDSDAEAVRVAIREMAGRLSEIGDRCNLDDVKLAEV